jgi:hypothetical protein
MIITWGREEFAVELSVPRYVTPVFATAFEWPVFTGDERVVSSVSPTTICDEPVISGSWTVSPAVAEQMKKYNEKTIRIVMVPTWRLKVNERQSLNVSKEG